MALLGVLLGFLVSWIISAIIIYLAVKSFGEKAGIGTMITATVAGAIISFSCLML
jgi:hypothetical protein